MIIRIISGAHTNLSSGILRKELAAMGKLKPANKIINAIHECGVHNFLASLNWQKAINKIIIIHMIIYGANNQKYKNANCTIR